MEDKIILLPFDEALDRYNKSENMEYGSILGLDRYDWNNIYQYSKTNNAKLIDIDGNLYINFGYYTFWVPAVCIDFEKSDITDINLFVNLINILR